ncbi:hypothetical protein PENTCL1PPCAC_16187, partial [Pristionchus entomophagus]
GNPIALTDFSEHPVELRSNSEGDVVENLKSVRSRTEQDGKQTDRVRFHLSLARRGFFWIFLIVVSTCLFCLVTLIGVFFYEGDDAVQNAASIGLTTMTSLMLVVTILSDELDKSDNLPALGWFVFVEIFVVCLSVIILLILDGFRSVARGNSRRNKENCFHRLVASKKAFRAARLTLFLLSITALILNAILNGT